MILWEKHCFEYAKNKMTFTIKRRANYNETKRNK